MMREFWHDEPRQSEFPEQPPLSAGFHPGTRLTYGRGEVFVVPAYKSGPIRHEVRLTRARPTGMTYIHLNKRVYLVDVAPGSPAWVAGLRPNVLIIGVQGKVVTEQQLPSMLIEEARGAGWDTVYVDVLNPESEEDSAHRRESPSEPLVYPQRKSVASFGAPASQRHPACPASCIACRHRNSLEARS
ncbi:hypothetical protein DIPPA_50077 [Diplonema papillatum]|nr:hypothetical protein DIPPA_50077 [Diplonema papillatum]